MEAIKKIKLDMVSRGYPPVVYAVQNDSGTRKIQASLFADGAEWNVPTDATASVSYRKQDGTVGRYDSTESGNPACVFSGNTATIELNDQFLTVAGDVIASIVFNKGFVQIATFPFVVHVDGFPSQNSPVSNNFYKYETLEELNKAISSLGEDISEINDNLQESFVFHVRMSEETEEYESEQTYKQLFDAADELFAGGNARPVYCAFWTDSVKEYILLPLTSYDTRIGEFTFTRTDVEYGVYVTVSERYGIHVYKSNLSLRDGIPDELPNPQPLTINGVAYDGSAAADIVTTALTVTVNSLDDGGYTCDKTMDELKAAHNAGRELYCVLGARLPMIGEYGTTSSNIWGYTFRGIVNGKEYSVNIGTDGISVTYTKLAPDALPNPQPLTINGAAYDGSEAEIFELAPLEKRDFFDEAYCGVLGGLVSNESVFWNSATATSIKLAVDANTTYIVRLPGRNRNTAGFIETGEFVHGAKCEPITPVVCGGDGNYIKFQTGDKAGYVAVYFHTGGYDIDANIADIHVYKDTIKADPNPKILGKYLPTVEYGPLDVLIFGDSITANVTVTYNDKGETTAYTPDVVDNEYVNADGETVRYAQWPSLIQRWIPVAEMRNYAQAGASFKDAERQSGYERQNLSFQIDLAVNDLANPNGVFGKDDFDPDIVIFAIGINDGAPNDTYDSAMEKTVMTADGTAFDVDATLAALDLSKFNEAVRHAFMRIRRQFPMALVMCVLPLQQTFGMEADKNALREDIRKMARRYSITVIDSYGESGIVRDFETQNAMGTLLKDGIHPNEKGQNLYARMMVQAIRRYYLPLDGLN